MAKWENCIGYGLLADRPGPGAPGALYFDTTSNILWRDNGTSWNIVGLGPMVVQPITGDTTLTTGNLLVTVTSGSPSVTLPDPILYKGTPITIKVTTGVTITDVRNPDHSFADQYSQRPWHGVSDGTQWWNTDF